MVLELGISTIWSGDTLQTEIYPGSRSIHPIFSGLGPGLNVGQTLTRMGVRSRVEDCRAANKALLCICLFALLKKSQWSDCLQGNQGGD